MKEFYNVKDVQKITDCSQSLAYEIIRKLRDMFSDEYPEAITIQGKIPIWYFNEKILCKKNKEEY